MPGSSNTANAMPCAAHLPHFRCKEWLTRTPSSMAKTLGDHSIRVRWRHAFLQACSVASTWSVHYMNGSAALEKRERATSTRLLRFVRELLQYSRDCESALRPLVCQHSGNRPRPQHVRRFDHRANSSAGSTL